jgi:hypothetical protein
MQEVAGKNAFSLGGQELRDLAAAGSPAMINRATSTYDARSYWRPGQWSWRTNQHII